MTYKSIFVVTFTSLMDSRLRGNDECVREVDPSYSVVPLPSHGNRWALSAHEDGLSFLFIVLLTVYHRA